MWDTIGYVIERTLFSFIWRYSKWAQLRLLLVTLLLFPLLYLTLELPKRIINDAIGANASTVPVLGVEVGQITYLMLLCAVFLGAVLGHGLLKMRINTMKGVLSERLLRRFRYTLIERILRFPAPYFERTSQGELVSMVTSEAEPMGGLMGDAVAQPVLQAGQMLTILGFLFAQNPVFGLAASALIPLQAWLIPKLQRQINLMNKERVIEVRALAAEIGETAAGAATLRLNGGWRYRLAMISDRLGRLFDIRFRLYRKKFFMKFVNNFIGQMTPFFFYSLGGYLVIRGDITVGALVAALAAYKDLSSPWKELLAYYNQTADMAVRWETVTERFAPDNMVAADLLEGLPTDLPRLAGDIALQSVTVRDPDGTIVLEDLNATLPAASTIAITAASEEDRRALTALLTREVLSTSGTITMAGHDLRSLHQATIARRIGHASATPVMFRGKMAENVNMALRTGPQGPAPDTARAEESALTGNSTDPLAAVWLDAGAAGMTDEAELQDWWTRLVAGTGLDAPLFGRAIELDLDPDQHPDLAQAVVKLRADVQRSVIDAGLDKDVSFFDENRYNLALPVAENLLFAMPLQPLSAQVLLDHPSFLSLLKELNLEHDLLLLSADLVEFLTRIFGIDGTDHPLFLKLGLDPGAFETALSHLPTLRRGGALTRDQVAQLLAVPLVVPAAKIGPSFPAGIIEKVLEIRKTHGAHLRRNTDSLFAPLSADQPIRGLSVLENTLFGKLMPGAQTDALTRVAEKQLHAAGLQGALLRQLFDLPLSLGGSNLPATLVEPLSLCRATIKRPDLLILDGAMASFDASLRETLHHRLHRLLPEAIILTIAPEVPDPEDFDHHFVLQNGRLSAMDEDMDETGDATASADLARKIRALERTHLFTGLKTRQLRLLAFGARWHNAKAGETIFRQGDAPTMGAFVILEGTVEMIAHAEDGSEQLVTTSGPGDIVGELALIRQVPRALDMRARSDITCLRIGAEEFIAVVQNDASTAYKLMQVIAGYV
ncbi:ABC transporter transmembrane domain-containing protein [Sulfitobacter sp. HNIBRBA3233]|uniref:ABC transporter transmembrane domain-containing protein n=1 Tax=Sulfitobacter marinivivus TaxID=3158558 RepID=UPI0032DE64BD